MPFGFDGDWGPEEEMLHPRGAGGRWRRKLKVPDTIPRFLGWLKNNFKPRTFQSQNQAGQYVFNMATRNPAKRMTKQDISRYRLDFDEANAVLREGRTDPTTEKYVQMMDRVKIQTDEDLITAKTFSPAAFGLTPQQMDEKGGPFQGLIGAILKDPGYSAAHIGESPNHGPGRVTMTIATPKGTSIIAPAAHQGDGSFTFDKGQNFAITRAGPDGRGGWNVMAVATTEAGDGPEEPIGRDTVRGLNLSPEEREARINLPARRRPEAEPPRAPENQTFRENQPADPARVAELDAKLAQTKGTGERLRLLEEFFQERREGTANLPPARGQTSDVAEAATPQRSEDLPEGVEPRTEQVVSEGLGESGRSPAEVAQDADARAARLEKVRADVAARPPTADEFEAAYRQSGIQVPANGPRRVAFYKALDGIRKEKRSPRDVLNDLESDIAHLNEENLQLMEADPESAKSLIMSRDMEKLDNLADLIVREHRLNEPDRPSEVAERTPEAPGAPAPMGRAGAGGTRLGTLSETQKDSVVNRDDSLPISDNPERVRVRNLANQVRQERGIPLKEEPTVREEVPSAPVKKARTPRVKKAAPGAGAPETTPEATPEAPTAPAKRVRAPAAKKAAAPRKPADELTEEERLARIKEILDMPEEPEGAKKAGRKALTKEQQDAAIRELAEPSARPPRGPISEVQRRAEARRGAGPMTDEDRAEQRRRIEALVEGGEAPAPAPKPEGTGEAAKKAAKTAKAIKKAIAPVKKVTPDAKKKATALDELGDIPGEDAGLLRRTREDLASGRITATEAKKLLGDRADFWDDRITNGAPSTDPDFPDDIRRDWQKKRDLYDKAAIIMGARKGAPKKRAPRKAGTRAERVAAGDLDSMTKDELLEAAKAAGVDVRQSWTKDKIKAAMQGGPPAAAAAPAAKNIDRMTKTELLERAAADGVTVDPKWTKDRIKAGIRGEGVAPAAVAEPEIPNPVAQQTLKQTPERLERLEAAFDKGFPNFIPQTSAERSFQEVIADVGTGEITPDEGVRRLENEISDRVREASDLRQQARRAGLRTAVGKKLNMDAAELDKANRLQETGSNFLREHFKDEPQLTVEEALPEVKEALPSTFGDKLRAVSGDQMRADLVDEQGKHPELKGLDLANTPGDTGEEVFDNALKKVLERELKKRGLDKPPGAAPAKKAAKAVKKAAPPKAPDKPLPNLAESKYQRIDVRALAEGLDIKNQALLDGIQKDLDEGKTPSSIGKGLLGNRVSGPRVQAAFRKGVTPDSKHPWETDEEFQKRIASVDVDVADLERQAEEEDKLAQRLQKVRRQAKKADAPPPAPVKVTAAEKKDIAKAAELTGIDAETLEKSTLAKKKAEAPPKPSAQQVVETLKTVATREEAESILNGRTKDELKEIAKAGGLESVRPSDTKARMVETIRGVLVDHRIEARAIMDMEVGGGNRTSKMEDAAVEDRIRTAFQEALDAGDRGSNGLPADASRSVRDVRMSAVRKRAGGDISKEEFDAALLRLRDRGEVRLRGDENQQTVTAEDRAGSIGSGRDRLDTMSFEPERPATTKAVDVNPEDLSNRDLTPDELVTISVISSKGGLSQGGWVRPGNMPEKTRPHLDKLAEMGYLEKHTGANGSEYRINPSQMGTRKAQATAKPGDALVGDVLPAPAKGGSRESLERINRGALVIGYEDPANPGTFGNEPVEGARKVRVSVQQIDPLDEEGNPTRGIFNQTHRRIIGKDLETGQRVESKLVSLGSGWEWEFNPDTDDTGVIEGELAQRAERLAKATSPPVKAIEGRAERLAKATTPPAAATPPSSMASRLRPNGKIPLSSIQRGDRILAKQDSEGRWMPSTTKGNATAVTVDSKELAGPAGGFRRTTNRTAIIGHDDQGNEVRIDRVGMSAVPGMPGHQTFIPAPEAGAVPTKRAAKAASRAKEKAVAPSGHPLLDMLSDAERQKLAKDITQTDRRKVAIGDVGSKVGLRLSQMDKAVEFRGTKRAVDTHLEALRKAGVPEADLAEFKTASDLQDQGALRTALRNLEEKLGLTRIGRAGQDSTFDPEIHDGTGLGLTKGDPVNVVGAGYKVNIDGEDVMLTRATVIRGGEGERGIKAARLAKATTPPDTGPVTVRPAGKPAPTFEIPPAKKAPAKKAQKPVAGPGGATYTFDELMEMEPSELRAIEDQLGVERPSLARDDRANAILKRLRELAS